MGVGMLFGPVLMATGVVCMLQIVEVGPTVDLLGLPGMSLHICSSLPVVSYAACV